MKFFGILFFLSSVAPAFGYYPSSGQLNSPLIDALAAGSSFTCVLAGSTQICWGDLKDYWYHEPSFEHPTKLNSSGSDFCVSNDVGALECTIGITYWAKDALKGAGRIAVGGGYICGTKGDGVECWFTDYNSQHKTVPVLHKPTALAAGYDFGCAIDQGAVKCWNALSGGSDYTQIPALKNPRELAARGGQVCALDDDGIACWYGQPESKHYTGLKNAHGLSLNGEDVCAIGDQGVKCWGRNNSIVEQIPVLKNPRLVTVGSNYACAVDDEGAKCWGQSASGAASPPPEAFGIASVEHPFFNLDRLSSFFQVVARVSPPAKAKFFRSLANYLDRELPASNRSRDASLGRLLLASLAKPSLEHIEASFVQERLVPAYSDQVRAFGRALGLNPSNENTKAPMYYIRLPLISLTVARFAIEGMRDFLSPEEYAPFAAIYRDVGTAMADSENSQKLLAVREGIIQNGRLLDRLQTNPRVAFLAAALWATTWNF
jgi:hypothetical protein